MKKQPEVTARTRQKLIDSFWDICLDKGLDKVSVIAITKNTGCNRSTFYEYFTDVFDLLHQVEDEMISGLMVQIEDKFSEGLPVSLQTLSRECASVFNQFDGKLFYLLSAKGDPAFSSRFKNRFLSALMEFFDFGDKNQYAEYILTFCYSAILGIRLYWYENGQKCDLEEIINITQTLIATGALGFIGKKYFE